MITHAMLLLALAAPSAPAVSRDLSVKVDNVLAHLQAFQAIADANGGNRAAGLPGYAASAAYVANQLRAAGYTVQLQPFSFPFYRLLSPAVLEGKKRFAGVSTLEYSGNGDVSAAPQEAGDGCEATDFAEFTAGRVAVVKRGTCTFVVKAGHAVDAGAKALVVVDDKGTFEGTLQSPQPIPVVAVGPAVGEQVAKLKRVRVATRVESEERITHNVIAQTRGTGRVVMAGAHLDSVQAGPGINDNASGSAALLELALRAAKARPGLPLRFAWWGAEELGLLGSFHYVRGLGEEEKKNIKAYLNLDMIASPNPMYGIYDGDDSDKVGYGPGPKGSAKVEKAFEDYFTRKKLPYAGIDFGGRSDYGPFVLAGIASGGLFTGANSDKSEEEARRFGGTAGEPMDRCYHQACDDVRNISEKALKISTAAFVYAVDELSS
ncbi:M28 family peptidase [Nonomuraea longicatena]|uniref:Aminopeptidase PaaP n=1 Tax=Nonomuraea longicatena TaxID=83682 RepID=A0ABN1QNM8_9ACTN